MAPKRRITINRVTLETVLKRECSLPAYGAIEDLLREAVGDKDCAIVVRDETTGCQFKLTKNGLVGPQSRRLFTIAMECLKSGLDEMGQFIDVGESALKSEFNNWGDWYDKRTQGFSEEETQEFVDAYYDDLAMVRDKAPQLFRQACAMMLIGFWETTVADLVRTLQQFDLLHPPEIEEPLYHDRSKKYLLDRAGFDKSAFGGAWSFCQNVNDIRDIIAHNNGILPCTCPGDPFHAKVERARGFIGPTAHISLSALSSIDLEEGFCRTVYEKVRQCIERLIAEAERVYGLQEKNHRKIGSAPV